MTDKREEAQSCRGIATVDGVCLVSLLGVLGLLAVEPLGQRFETAVGGRSATVGARSAPPPVGVQAEAALNLARLFSTVDRLPDGARQAVDARRFESHLAASLKNNSAVGVGQAMVPEALRNAGGVPADTHAPHSDQLVTAMRLLSSSQDRAETPLADLRRGYDGALTETIPYVLKTIREQYGEAFAHFGADSSEWLTYQRRAEQLVTDLASREALSSEDVFRLVEAVESAKHGRMVLVPRSFTPVFSESLIRLRPIELVDAFIAARDLHASQNKILFPYEVLPPSGTESAPIRRKAFELVLLGGDARSRYVTSFIENASRPRLTPERIRRRALLQQTFPGSELYANRTEDARAIIASTYDQAASSQQQNRFSEWWVHVREDLKADLTDEQRAMVRQITSLPRIALGLNRP